MAKISAHGAHVTQRWRNDKGSEYVLTTDGRLLWKIKGGTYTVSRKYANVTAAREFLLRRLATNGYDAV